jgi:hypothetical protein
LGSHLIYVCGVQLKSNSWNRLASMHSKLYVTHSVENSRDNLCWEFLERIRANLGWFGCQE